MPKAGLKGSTSHGGNPGLTLHELILRSALAGVGLQREDGSMPPGHNGPYGDPETPTRNTAHWLITFLFAFEKSGKASLRHAAERALDYLLADPARPEGKTFLHRTNPRKDRCNGLIGQAWTIEALTTAGSRLGRGNALSVAERVFLLHPFREKALWQRVEVDGTELTLDYTFNHQVWFAASGGLLAQATGNMEIRDRVGYFLGELPRHMGQYRSGLIRHPLASVELPRSRRRWPKRWILKLRSSRKNAVQALGYHAFNLYGLGLLKSSLPDHPFWESDALRRAVDYMRTARFSRRLSRNPFAYPYNPPGFEIPFAAATFAAEPLNGYPWIDEQLRRCYDFDANLMNRGTPDGWTHAARLYEATRVPNQPVLSAVP